MREAGGPPTTEAPRRYADGDVITRQGSAVAEPAIVREGLVRASLLAEDGREVVVALLGRGEVFDECALLPSTPSPVTVRAIGATTIARVRDTSPLAVALARRIEAAIDLLEEAMLHDVRSRLLRRLQDLALRAPDGARIPLTQEELGRMVGATRETVNRALRELLAAGALPGGASATADAIDEVAPVLRIPEDRRRTPRRTRRP